MPSQHDSSRVGRVAGIALNRLPAAQHLITESKLVGVGVGFNAVKLGGIGARQQPAEAVLSGEDADFFFQVKQPLEGQIEEVAGAAGRIEDSHGGKLGGESAQQFGKRLACLGRGGAFALAFQGRTPVSGQRNAEQR
jgi:hypothetical protein